MTERTKLVLADAAVALGTLVIAAALAMRWASANGIVVW
jgi:hypothetical protein